MRKQTLERKTKETHVKASLNLDGTGKHNINTGIGFLDHMLELFCVHGDFDLDLECKGDLKTDGHHSVEDIGIVLGKLINILVDDKNGIARYAHSVIPMDEALAEVVLDISGRPFLAYTSNVEGKIGDYDVELTEEFFKAVSTYGLITLHIRQLDGKNSHHITEAIFKAFARALSAGVKIIGNKVLSSKGMLE